MTLRDAACVRVTVALKVLNTDLADALTIAWDAFRSAARDKRPAAGFQMCPFLPGVRR